eukprot:356868-Chlamydomonas_euryale.AAC.12
MVEVDDYHSTAAKALARKAMEHDTAVQNMLDVQHGGTLEPAVPRHTAGPRANTCNGEGWSATDAQAATAQDAAAAAAGLSYGPAHRRVRTEDTYLNAALSFLLCAACACATMKWAELEGLSFALLLWPAS